MGPVYGNRSYGNALVELYDILRYRGFPPIAAAAFVGQHSFTTRLATGRPDREDLEKAEQFSAEIVRRILQPGEFTGIKIPGQGAPDYGGYYKPKGRDEEVVNFLKAKPVTTIADVVQKFVLWGLSGWIILLRFPVFVSSVMLV